MTHFLITAIGSYGDVHPMIGLGAALRARGHDVQIVTNPYFEELASDNDLGFLPLSTREKYLELTQQPDLWHPRRGARLVLEWGMVRYLKPLYEIVDANAVPGKTILIPHVLDLASRVLGERRSIPVASAVFSPQGLWSVYQTPKIHGAWLGDRVPHWFKRLQYFMAESLVVGSLVGRPLNRLRREVGLPPVRRFLSNWWLRTPLVLGMFPDWFAPPQPDWPPNLVITGFPLWDGGQERELSSEIQDFVAAGDRPLVFSPGSANRAAHEFFRTAVEVCQRLGRRGFLMTKYPDQLPATLPPTVRHFGFLPLSRVLPHAAAFIHHGGIGSCAQGLAGGVPHLVRPMAFDQFDNAARLVRLGVGEEVSVRRFNGTLVAEKLRRLLESPEVAARCDELAARCDGPAALARACEAIETLTPRLDPVR